MSISVRFWFVLRLIAFMVGVSLFGCQFLMNSLYVGGNNVIARSIGNPYTYPHGRSVSIILLFWQEVAFIYLKKWQYAK